MRQTSIIANRASTESGLKDIHKQKILKSLEKRKRGTSYHISMWTGIDYVAVARRMSELESNGSVIDLGKVGFSPTGNIATVWELSAKEDINY